MGWELTPGGPFHGPYVAHLVATHGSSDQLTSHLATVDLATTPWLQWIRAIPPSAASGVTPFAAGCGLCGADLDPRRGQRPVPARRQFTRRFPARWRPALRSGEAKAPACTTR